MNVCIFQQHLFPQSPDRMRCSQRAVCQGRRRAHSNRLGRLFIEVGFGAPACGHPCASQECGRTARVLVRQLGRCDPEGTEGSRQRHPATGFEAFPQTRRRGPTQSNHEDTPDI